MHNQQRYSAREVLHEGDTQIINTDKNCISVLLFYASWGFFLFPDKTVTLSIVIDKLSPRLAQLKVLHKVFSTGIAEVPPDTRNVVRASHLLNTLYKAILEYDSVGEASEQTVGEIIPSLIEQHTRTN